MGKYVYRIPQEPNVQPWLTKLDAYASQSYSAADDMAGQLNSFEGELLDPTYTPPDVIASDIGLGDVKKPIQPNYQTSGAIHPGAIDVGSVAHTVISAPPFDVERLSINLPGLPYVVDPTDPTKPIVDFDIPFPEAPDTDLPDEPVLIDITIPILEPIDLPIFDSELPVDNIVVPGMTFSFNEELYSDTLLTKVKDELLVRLSGGTGLSPVVENAIWDRGRDREHTASLQAERKLLIESAQTGFTRPSGAVRAALDRLTQETQGKIIELSREIMIKQAELEQENIKTSIQQTIALEEMLIREHNNIQERSFQVAKYMQDIAIELYKASVTHYNLKLEAYKTEVEVFNSLIKAELTKVEIYKSEIQAQSLISEINKQYIEIYNSQILAIKTTVDLYKTEVEAISEQLKAEALKIEAYKAEVEAYSAKVSANTQKYEAYSEQVKGEAIKSDINKTEVEAYASRVQAYATEQSSYDKQAGIALEVKDLKIKQYLANLDGYIKQIQADQLNFQAQVDLFKGESSMYDSEVAFNTASSNILLKDFENQIQQTQFSSAKSLEAIKVNADLIAAENTNRVTAMQASGSIYAQIASSSLNAINVSASNGSVLTNSLGENYNLSGEV